jgi:hypothetical protein
MPLIRTQAHIDAPPEQVWAVLADFARYAEWNPLNLTALGEARLGERVDMTFLNLVRPGKAAHMPVWIVACEPGRSLAWEGAVPLVIGGRHSFDLTPEGAGTRLVHCERMYGLIPWLLGQTRIDRDFTPAYEATNLALAARCAALAERSSPRKNKARN